MNKYYSYDNIELWDPEVWKDKVSAVFPLVLAIEENDTPDLSEYPYPVDGKKGNDAKTLDCYHPKMNSVDIPEVIEYWKNKGVHYECRSQGGLCWLVMAPIKCLENYGDKLPSIVVPCLADLEDPYWPMKLLEQYRSYNEMVAEQQDVILVYICSRKPDINRIYVNIMQEAYVFVPGDNGRVFMDVSSLTKKGLKLSDVEGFAYKDNNGNAADPDAAVFEYGSAKIPVLDISGRWENLTSLSRDQIGMENWSSASYNFEAYKHTQSG